VCDLETSRMGAPYIYDISRLRVKHAAHSLFFSLKCRLFYNATFLFLYYSHFTYRMC